MTSHDYPADRHIATHNYEIHLCSLSYIAFAFLGYQVLSGELPDLITAFGMGMIYGSLDSDLATDFVGGDSYFCVSIVRKSLDLYG